MKRIFLTLLIFVIFLAACSSVGPPEEINSVPSGDPGFPPLTGLVIDQTNRIPTLAITQANEYLEQLRNDGVAEVVIVIINGVHHPELWATRFGRSAKVGSSETDNGVVYLIRPDAPAGERIIYSIGRGLPKFSSGDVTRAVEQAKPLVDEGKIAEALPLLAQDTSSVLREDYKANPEGVPATGDEETLTPEQEKQLVKVVLWAAGIWFLIGLVILPFNPEFAFQWWILGLRLLLIFSIRGGSGRKSGGSFGGRSGSR